MTDDASNPRAPHRLWPSSRKGWTLLALTCTFVACVVRWQWARWQADGTTLLAWLSLSILWGVGKVWLAHRRQSAPM